VIFRGALNLVGWLVYVFLGLELYRVISECVKSIDIQYALKKFKHRTVADGAFLLDKIKNSIYD